MPNSINVNVILAEDNLNDAELSLRMLRKHLLVSSVTHVKDGAELLDMALAQLSSINPTEGELTVILLDLKLPKVDGMEVVRQLKCRQGAERIPIIVMTSSCLEADFLSSYIPAADGFLLKPIECDDFTKAITGCICRARAQSSITQPEGWDVTHPVYT